MDENLPKCLDELAAASQFAMAGQPKVAVPHIEAALVAAKLAAKEEVTPNVVP